MEVYLSLYRLKEAGIMVYFCWVPAHVGVSGNEVADKLAKKALDKREVDVKVPVGKKEAKSILKKNVMNKCQIRWNNSSTVVLHRQWGGYIVREETGKKKAVWIKTGTHRVDINTGTNGFA